ncbi:MAG: FHA domain-containing protein, partial [Kiritimatiellae bacterium]|nr:FHA domain-containing protein [Kiritimatiellia bacterium]
MRIIRLNPDTREPTAESWTLDAHHPDALIGRGEKATILLDDPSVSQEHARAAWQHGSLLLMDYGSINGVTLRNRRIRRAEFRRDEVVMVGAVPLQIRVEPADRSAWARMLAMRAALLVLAVVALLVVLQVAREMNAAPGAASEEAEFTPLQPPVPDAATQREYERMLESHRLTTEAESLLMLPDRDAEAAELLIRSIRNYDYPANRAHTMLEGLQAKHFRPAAEKIRADMERADFAAAEEDYLAIAAFYLDEPDELRRLHDGIDQNRRFDKALAMMREGEDPDGVRDILESLDETVVPGLADAKARLARMLEA